MNLVWHIVRKDFRRLLLPLALWVAVLVAQGEIGVHALRSSDPLRDQLFYLGLANSTLRVVGMLVNVLLVAALVQADALVGSRIFWTTRPISGARMLAAKLTGAGLMFGVLPLLIAVRWWLVCGYGATEMVKAGLAILDQHMAVVLPSMLLAALTRHLNQFLGWVVGLGAGGALWVFWLASWMPWKNGDVTIGANETRIVFTLLVVGIGGLTVIAHQFVTRRLRRSLVIVAVVSGVAVTTSPATWDFSWIWNSVPAPSALTANIVVAAEGMNFPRLTSITYTLTGVPEESGVALEAEHAWRWEDGTIIRARDGLGLFSWPGSAEWRALGFNLPAARIDPVAQAYAAAGPGGAQGAGKLVRSSELGISPESALRWVKEHCQAGSSLRCAMARAR